MHDGDLNPAQRDTLELLGANAAQRPTFDAELRHLLAAHLNEALEPLVAALPDGEDLFVSKYDLAQVHGCEVRYLADTQREFAWTVPLARGTVSHKAIELLVNWPGEPAPATLVDEALAKLEHDGVGVSEFLTTCTSADRAELRGQAIDRVTKFVECFPPLRTSWRPVVESRLRAEVAGGRVVLGGRADLTLGRSVGTTAGKVIVDLKTGNPNPSHRDDLRYYALVETLRLGVPPRLVASYYLDAARVETENVTEGMLEAAARRLVAGAERMVALREDPEGAVLRPGGACRWCPVLDDCTEGRAHLDQRDADLGAF